MCKICVATRGRKSPSKRLLTRLNPIPDSLPRTGLFYYLNHRFGGPALDDFLADSNPMSCNNFVFSTLGAKCMWMQPHCNPQVTAPANSSAISRSHYASTATNCSPTATLSTCLFCNYLADCNLLTLPFSATICPFSTLLCAQSNQLQHKATLSAHLLCRCLDNCNSFFLFQLRFALCRLSTLLCAHCYQLQPNCNHLADCNPLTLPIFNHRCSPQLTAAQLQQPYSQLQPANSAIFHPPYYAHFDPWCFFNTLNRSIPNVFNFKLQFPMFDLWCFSSAYSNHTAVLYVAGCNLAATSNSAIFHLHHFAHCRPSVLLILQPKRMTPQPSAQTSSQPSSQPLASSL